ncbi:hypothetical protein [Azospirillum halopraeferens]|uniref:hypothetical protein n=1 Tax=Azospirillum halopraeferens TaxID=34010 RepID=UPI00041F257D|nr:hypothetical protein [Azospirillum halopraeferens]
MIRFLTFTLAALALAVPGGVSALTYGAATCDQLVDEVIETKKRFDAVAAEISRQGEQPATKQETVQLSLLTQRHDRAFAVLATRCPETLADINFD